MTHTRFQGLSGMLLIVGAVAMWGCQRDLPTGVDALSTPTFSVVASEHETEPDPRIPPVCHGYTATIWWNMPAELIPKGATIKPHVLDVRPDEGDVDPLEDHDDASGGWGYRIVGTSGDDVIVGSPKKDRIFGQNGNDLLYGGPGPDRLYGGNDRDRLYGEVSNNWLFGEAGIDWLFGGSGRDVLDGGTGDNHLESGDQADEPDDGCGGH
ncbi:MAG: hypothetical protein IPF98_10910 [Gemmatimonadetes bacterium]|nr:hypothetical protein [Gemmatimonadota bacterium]MCC6770939.1 hypothetical protein [Gemmatimonadaceae bacterium]